MDKGEQIPEKVNEPVAGEHHQKGQVDHQHQQDGEHQGEQHPPDASKGDPPVYFSGNGDQAAERSRGGGDDGDDSAGEHGCALVQLHIF